MFQVMSWRLYTTQFFLSHLIYGCQVWGQVTNSYNQKVFKLQNRALLFISFSDFRADSTPIFSNLKILKLRDLIVLQNCLFVHDALNNASPKLFNEYFRHTKEVHPQNTKSANLGCLFVSHIGTIRYGNFSITNKCISNWNSISKILKLDLLNSLGYNSNLS